MVAALLLFFIALLMMLAAVLTVLRARRLEQIAKVTQRLEAVAFLSSEAGGDLGAEGRLLDALEKWLSRVGLQVKPSVALAALLAILISGFLVLSTWGKLAGALWWGISSVVFVFIPQVRYKQKVNRLVDQIPLFIDQVIRGLVTGRNIEGAIRLACEDVQEPLASLMERVHRNTTLGADLGDAMRDAANFYDVRELHMLALAIHTSRVYGGSPREMLESVVSLIRQREQMRRELRAMTGETRVTAWVLGLMPLGVAGFMVSSSPDFIVNMWHDESGRMVLMLSAGLQAVGGLVLWRMIKSI